jgi:hypothetical protein
VLGPLGLVVVLLVGAALYVVLGLLHRQGRLAHDWHRDLLAVGAVLGCVIAFYWPLLFTESWIPKGGGDLASFIFPTYTFAARWIRRGIVPLWNPHLYLGMPFLADNQSGLFYPINLLFFVLLPQLTYQAVELMSVLHVLLAGLLTYLLLRDLPSLRAAGQAGAAADGATHKMGRIPATAGAIAYMLSDLFVVHPGNLNIVATAAWLPLVLLCFKRALVRRSAGWAAGAGIALGIAALAGHAQMTLYVGLALSLFAAYEAVTTKGGWRTRLLPIGQLMLAGAVSFGIAAVALVPALDMNKYTVRASMSYPEAAAFSVPPAGLVGILVPGFFGRGTGTFWGPWSRTEMGYVGVLPLLLACVGVALGWKRSRMARFWVVLGVFGLLMALGPYTIVHGLSYALIPVFRQLRVPARAIFLFDFSVSMLAAQGLDSLLRPLRRSERRVLRALRVGGGWIALAVALVAVPILGHAVLASRMQVPEDVFAQQIASLGSVIVFLLLLGVGLAILLMRERRGMPTRALGIVAGAVIALDLISLGAYVEVEPNDPLVGYRHEEAIAFLRADPDVFRVELAPEVTSNWAPDWALIYEMDDPNGIWNPLRLGAYDVLTWVGIQRADPFYDLYNIKYLVASRETAIPAHFRPAFEQGDELIYLNTAYLPRAYMVYDVILASGDISALNKARAEGFDPSSQVVLKQDSPTLAVQGAPGARDGEVTVTDRGPNHLAFRVSTASAGYLFVSEMWMPGWKAYVDGEVEPVLQANYTFRAVPITAGDHEVRMVYRPFSWLLGLGATLITLTALVTWGGWAFWKQRGKAHRGTNRA